MGDMQKRARAWWWSGTDAEKTETAYADFERIRTKALAEYHHVAGLAWAECERSLAAAWAEYERKVTE